MVRIPVKRDVLVWARERARLDTDDLARRFPHLVKWESGAAAPTLKQLEKYAHATRTALGLLLLPQPPEDNVPIPDFRTIDRATLERPSADLLDTIFHCQQRQDWYRSWAQTNREDAIEFVGSAKTKTDIDRIAARMRGFLNFDIDERGSSWSEALSRLAARAERAGVLVMTSGIVGSNTRRKLDPDEFRGFALADDLAPLVFVNGADTKAAQNFTLAHELAHLWLGQSALSDISMSSSSAHDVERWCNKVAAEFLAPIARLIAEFDPRADLTEELQRLARLVKASTLVVLVRLYDGGLMPATEFDSAYAAERARLLGMERGRGAGGDFYNTELARVGHRFARALVTSTLEGNTLHRDALSLLSVKKLSTFQELAARLDVA